MERAWFSYTRNGSPTLPENYIYTTLKPTCTSGRVVCAIYAPYIGGVNPFYISFNLQNYIATGVAQPLGPWAKRFVYFLPF